MRQIFESDIWINESFGAVELGDKRLNSRLETMVRKMIKKPEASLPKQMEGKWSDIIGSYRFLNNCHVTHKRVQLTHLTKTLREASECRGKTTLFVQDGSEIEAQKSAKGAGPIGNHTLQGIMMHNCLAIEYDEENPRLIGLANQRIWKRQNGVRRKSETRTQRYHRNGKESEHWLKTLKAIGTPPSECKWVSIGDRGNDIYEFFSGIRDLNWNAVIRASQDRLVEFNGELQGLMTVASKLPIGGTKTIKIRRKGDSTHEEILMSVAWGEVKVYPPKRISSKHEPLTLWVVRCFNEEEGVDWVLYSTIPVTTLAEALEKIEWYSCRWIIEEYHKCLKSGCKIESNQFESVKPIEVLLGILSVVSVLIFQVKYLARKDDDTLAIEIAPKVLVDIIGAKYNLNTQEMTIKVFWRSVAKLGGFIGRKSDGDPGWQTIWGGWLRLLDMWMGAEALRSLQ